MEKLNIAIRKGLIFFIEGYQYLINPLLGSNCRFYPSCSGYTKIALNTFGIFKGGILSLQRILRCHPWHEGGNDPVPQNEELL